jgi:hypothetical protein
MHHDKEEEDCSLGGPPGAPTLLDYMIDVRMALTRQVGERCGGKCGEGRDECGRAAEGEA